MRQLGVDGEFIASQYLETKDYHIIAKNFHSRFGEIDIIATHGKTLVFVEVKLRSSWAFGSPFESITNKKIEKMKKTAYYFMTLKNMNKVNFRFDAVGIDIDKSGGRKIEHIENITD